MVHLIPHIQHSLVHTNSPSDHWPHWNKLVPLIRHHIHSTLFWHALNKTHPSTICNKINDFGIQPLNYILFHYILYILSEPFRCSIIGLWSGISWILCEQISEGILIMSAFVHQCLSWTSSKILLNILLVPHSKPRQLSWKNIISKSTYLRWGSRAFKL